MGSHSDCLRQIVNKMQHELKLIGLLNILIRLANKIVLYRLINSIIDLLSYQLSNLEKLEGNAFDFKILK